MSILTRCIAILLLGVCGNAAATIERTLDPAEVAARQLSRPQDFALALPLGLDAQREGQWDLIGDTLRWTLEIHVAGAQALALELAGMQLPAGATLSIGTAQWQGPATLPSVFTRHEPGTRLCLQAEMPRLAAGQFALNIVAAQAAYRDPFSTPPVSKAADLCSVNFSCAADSTVQVWGGSVVALVILNTSTCTGTLMNNTAEDARPYLLTARHCYTSTGETDPARAAASLRMAWNAVAACGSPLATAWGYGTPVTSGARHRAEYGDTWLVELDARPPDSVGPWYAGFDAGDQSPQGPLIGLHNGAALQRQLLSTNGGASRTRISQFLGGIDVLGWGFSPQVGSALPGSSGSGLFDAGGRVIGTLSTGLGCDSGLPQVTYARLAQAWTGDGNPAHALRPWLDPLGRGLPQSGKSFVGQAVTPLSELPAITPVAVPVTGSTASTGSGGGGSFSLLLVLGLLFAAGARPWNKSIYR